MLKRVNKERVCCPVVFYEEIIAVFKKKNISNWHRNRQKTQNFHFQSFYAVFVKFIQTSWNKMFKTLNVAGIRCPVGFLEELIAVFKLKKISNWHRNRQQNHNFQTFNVFMQFLSLFSIDIVA